MASGAYSIICAMSSTSIRPDLFISADVETDGPVPGPFSMLSFGMSVVGAYDGLRLLRTEPQSDTTFYCELKPISERYELEALEINGLDRSRLLRDGMEPKEAMDAAADWVRKVSEGLRPVLVAYPVAFDWSFLYWYFAVFSTRSSPFGHSSCLDIRTLYQAIAGTVFDQSDKAAMPSFLQVEQPHTHNALDDAIEQGALFAKLFEFAARRRNALVHGHEHKTRDSGPSWLRRVSV
jgi:DNA polymerase III epsilon subunit-like protein